jgi:hypothetical protein
MGKRQSKKHSAPSAVSESGFPDLLWGWRWLAVLALLTLIFFWTPLTNPATTPQWDAIDVHYSSQKYFADHIRQGELPYWTPYIFSGFPFLADPQVGAWYPLNWPFFLIGITAKAIEAELALHTLLACAGMYLLLLRFTSSRPASLTGALFFSFSGYFADHGQHIGLYCAACWLPWLALFLLRALDGPFLRWTAAAGLAAGAMILAGGFQAALYAYYALALFALGVAALEHGAIPRIAGFLAGTLVISVMFSAIMALPGLELTAYSARGDANYGNTTDRILRLKGLANLFWPNATGNFTGTQSPDTAYYLYSGLLLVPFAALGLRHARSRWVGLMVAIPSLWYMLGPAFGLYRIGQFLPGLHKVRAPIHAWFVAIFGLSILAAAGAGWLFERQRNRPIFAMVVVCVVFGDLFYCNAQVNPGYARLSWEERYGNFEENTRQKVLLNQPPWTRFDAPDKLTAFGPLNHPLDLHLEATYGYNPIELTHYIEYRAQTDRNPKLLGAMNVSRKLDMNLGAIVPSGETLPRAYFARSMESIPDNTRSETRLATLDPVATTIVNGGETPSVDPQASVLSITPGEQELLVTYLATKPALLRVAIPFFPGWRATVNGAERPAIRVDHAFLGIEVPAGENQLVLRFHSTYFGWGAVLSALALLGGIALIAVPARVS